MRHVSQQKNAHTGARCGASTRRLFLAGSVLVPLSYAQRARANDLEAVRDSGVLRVGTAGDYAPFSAAQGKAFVGFDIDLARRLAKDLKLRVEFVRFKWPELLQNLQAGLFDVALSGIALRGDRTLSAQFSRPYAVTAALPLIRRADQARFGDASALDQPGVRLVVNAGGHLEKVARRLFSRAEIVTTSDNTKLFTPVLEKTADAALSDTAEAHAHPNSGLIALAPLTHDRKAPLLAAGADHFSQWLDGWLADRERDGFLPQLRRRYLGVVPDSALPFAAEGVFGALQLRSELMPFVGAYKASHHLPVEDVAQEARVLGRVASSASELGLDPDSVRALYRELITAAKEIERAQATVSNPLQPSLDELRIVIRKIDAQMLGTLRELLRDGITVDWTGNIARCLEVDGLSASRKLAIGEALSKVRAQR